MRIGRWAPVAVEMADFRTLTLPFLSRLSNVFSMVRLSTLTPGKPLVGSPVDAKMSKRARCASKNSLEPGCATPPDSSNILKNSFSRRRSETLLLGCGAADFSFRFCPAEAGSSEAVRGATDNDFPDSAVSVGANDPGSESATLSTLIWSARTFAFVRWGEVKPLLLKAAVQDSRGG